MRTSKLVTVILAVLMIVGMNQVVLADTGAIWTTDALGNNMNANTYAAQNEVYVNGRGFDAGSYDISVYQTAGNVKLGSTNASKRLVIDITGSFTVQLTEYVRSVSSGLTVSGFDTSDNNVYKVEVSKVGSNSKKSDNFKIVIPDPIETPVLVPTATPTATPTEKPRENPNEVTTSTPAPTPTPIYTHLPTATPTAAPTTAPTATPTAAPTATPAVTPTATPSIVPTATPSVTAIPATTPPAGAPTSTPQSTVAPVIINNPSVPAALPNTGGSSMTRYFGFGLIVMMVGMTIAFLPKRKETKDE